MSDAPRSGRSLDPETLAAYVDGRLPPDERSRVEAELAADPESYELLVHTLRAEQFVDEALPNVPEVSGGSGTDARSPKVIPFYRRRGALGVVVPVLAAAAALVLVVRLQPVWWQSMWGPTVDPRFEKLVAAVGAERYIEGRLTGGFKYGPLRSVTRGPGDLSNQNLALLAAVGELQKAAQADPTPENLHAWGVAQLLTGNPAEAVTTLVAATQKTKDANALADLAAAYLSLGSGRQDRALMFEALRQADQAIAVEPENQVALFNRALALDALGDSGRSQIAWKNYLATDSGSPWALIATERLERR